MKQLISIFSLVLILVSCKGKTNSNENQNVDNSTENQSEMDKNLSKYVSVRLTSDMSNLSENQRKMLPILINAADKMNELFWYEAYGNGEDLLSSIEDEATIYLVLKNYQL